MKQIIDIPTDKIKDPEIKRTILSEGLEELAKSISVCGILEPLLVVQRDNEYFLVAGRRRLLAARQLSMPTVPCLVIEADHEQALAATMHENLFREDLNPLDESNIYDYLSTKLKYSNRMIAKLVAKSEPYVSQRLDIRTWSGEIRDALAQNKISFSVARELAMIADPRVMKQYVGFAVAQGINYRTARKWRQDWELSQLPTPAEIPKQPSASLTSLQTITLGRCEGCRDAFPIDKLVTINVCQQCLDAIAQARIRSNEAQET